VNKVQLDIRTGHAQTVEKVLGWLKDEKLTDVTVCDVRPPVARSSALTRPQAGCGTGSLAIPLALSGATVFASDISSARPLSPARCRPSRRRAPQSMVGEAQRRYESESASRGAAPSVAPTFFTSDLESVSGKFHTVTCLDVMIHYPQEKADAMVQHLASLAESRLIISFAPFTPAYALLKRIGELFPGPSKATRAYLHAEPDVEAALAKVGWTPRRKEMTATSFYFSRLIEYVRA